MNYSLHPIDREAYEQKQMNLRTSLGAAIYEEARNRGEELSLEQALAYLEESLSIGFS